MISSKKGFNRVVLTLELFFVYFLVLVVPYLEEVATVEDLDLIVEELV